MISKKDKSTPTIKNKKVRYDQLFLPFFILYYKIPNSYCFFHVIVCKKHITINISIIYPYLTTNIVHFVTYYHMNDMHFRHLSNKNKRNQNKYKNGINLRHQST